MSTLRPNSVLQGGKYKIVCFISAGGFGCTYEGVHVLLKKRVAIKEFFVKDFCNRDEETSAVTIGITAKTALVHKLKDKFVEEAQFVSTLKSDHIVNVYDVFEENGTAYYVMDYIDGPSLNDIVKKEGALSEQKALKYILQVAEALKYVHSKNRLHLDIKPGNIMIDNDDNAILIDFGTSKQYDEEAGENTSTLMGKTPGYAPLEQMGNDVIKFYPSTDIYALGATLYKLLTGVTPPSANLLASGEELTPLASSISENVRNAVYKAMQTNKNKRPQSIDEFVEILTKPVEEDCTIFEEEENAKAEAQAKAEAELKAREEAERKRKEAETKAAKAKAEAEERAKAEAERKAREEAERKRKEAEAKAAKEKTEAEERAKAKKKSNNNRKISPKIIVCICLILLLSIAGGGYMIHNSNKNDVEENDTTTLKHIAQVEDAIKNQKEYVTGKTFKDGDGKEFTYTGEVAGGKPNGQGMGVYPYGNYAGEYKNGLRQGKGKFESKDGSNRYEGTFSNDKYENGRLTLSDGFYFDGSFKNGQPYNGKWYDKNGKFDSKVINGQ